MILGPSLPTEAPTHVRAIMFATYARLGTLFDVEPDFGETRVCPALNVRGNDVIVIVSFTGQVKGHVLLGMSRPTACAVAAALLMEPPAAFGELTRSAVAEIGNIVAGGCATALHQEGYDAAITVPSVIVGERVEVAWPHLFVIETAIMLPAGPVDLAVGLQLGHA